MSIHSRSKHLATCVEAVAVAVASGDLVPTPYKPFDSEGNPCCAVGHALHRFGFKGRDSRGCAFGDLAKALGLPPDAQTPTTLAAGAVMHKSDRYATSAERFGNPEHDKVLLIDALHKFAVELKKPAVRARKA